MKPARTTSRMPVRRTRRASYWARGSSVLIAALCIANLGQPLPGASASADPGAEVLWWKTPGQQLDGFAAPTSPTWARWSHWGDFDGAPGDELLVGGVINSGLRLEARDGSILWQYPTSGVLPTIRTLPAADLNDDGAEDVIAIGGGELVTLDGPTGAILSRISTSELPDVPVLWDAQHDLNGDGTADAIVWGREPYNANGDGLENETRSVEVVLSGRDLSRLWEYRVTPPDGLARYLHGLAIGDVDADGALEVAHFTAPSSSSECANAVREVILLDGRTGSERWSSSLPDRVRPWAMGIGFGRVVITAPTFATDCATPTPRPVLQVDRVSIDLPGKARLSVAPAVVQQVLLAYETDAGELAWEGAVPGPPSPYMLQNLLVGDLQGDGTQEVVVAASQTGSERSAFGTELDSSNGAPYGQTTATPNTHPDSVQAFDLETGTPVWAHKSDLRTRAAQIALIPRPGGGSDVAYATLNDVVLLAGSSASVRWSKRFSDAPADLFQPGYVRGCTALVNGCLSVPSWGPWGPWENLRDKPVGASYNVLRVEAQDLDGDGVHEVAVQGTMGWRRGFSRADGTEAWALTSLAGWTTAIAGPGGDDPDLFAGDRGGGVSGMTPQGKKLWTTVLSSSVSALHYDGGRVLAITSQRPDSWRPSEVAALDARTGRLLWRTPTGNIQPFGRPPHAFDDVDDDGVLDVVVGGTDDDDSGVQVHYSASIAAVSGATGEMLWERVYPVTVREDGSHVCRSMVLGLTSSAGRVMAKVGAIVGGPGATACEPGYGVTAPEAEAHLYGLEGRTGAVSWGPEPTTTDWVRHLTPISDGGILEVGWAGRGYRVSAKSAADGSELWSTDVLEANSFYEMLPVLSGDATILLRGDPGDGSASFHATTVDPEGMVSEVSEETLPAAVTATVTQDGKLVYAGLKGVFALSLAALAEGEVRVIGHVRLPARFPTPSSGEIDHPVADELQSFGPGGRLLFGYWTSSLLASWNLRWPNAGWVVRLD